MSYAAKIILDSIAPGGARLTTFELTYPRFIHAELMTHRMFSRNSASSRAVPTEKLLKRIEDDPALPVYWGANQSGMQAKEELAGDSLRSAQATWANLRGVAVVAARSMNAFGLHKQIANRVVEPWMFITVILTATELENARALRVDPDAQPEFEHIARKAFELYDDSTPRKLNSGEWHLPFVAGIDEDNLRDEGCSEDDLCAISVGRCARVSYLTHGGQRNPQADIDLYDKLLKSGHMSPFEHVAQAMTVDEWQSWAALQAWRWMHERVPVGNFWGWRQLRKTLGGEHDFSIIKATR